MKLSIVNHQRTIYHDTFGVALPDRGFILSGRPDVWFADINELDQYFEQLIIPGSIVRIADLEHDRNDLAILCCCAGKNADIYVNGQPIDVRLAQACSLRYSPIAMQLLLKDFTSCYEAGAICVNRSDPFNIIAHINSYRLKEYIYHNRRTIRKNAETELLETNLNDDYFRLQNTFLCQRFGRSIDPQYQAIQRYLFSQPGFKLYSYERCGDLLAYNVIYIDPQRRFLDDVSLIRDLRFQRLRLGYYAMIRNLIMADQLNYAYGLGPGRYPYKRQISAALTE